MKPSESENPEAEYLELSGGKLPLDVRIHLDAIDGIARDVAEGFTSIPMRGLEVGGLLLGVVAQGERTVVSIERFQRIDCAHSFGPGFVLDATDLEGLVGAAGAVFEGGTLAVTGMYRSQTRPGFQLEKADLELMERYFSDAADLFLLIKPESVTMMSAQFFARRQDGSVVEAGPNFPFRGRAVPLDTAMAAPTMEAARLEERPEPAQTERPARKFVADFAPGPVEPARAQGEEDSESEPTRQRPFVVYKPPGRWAKFRNWWPLAGAAVVVGGVLWALLNASHGSTGGAVPAVETREPVRPLGLTVDPAGQTWRVSWNPNATALRDARGVQLFVRGGDDQNRIDLSPHDLATGTYDYKPTGGDVTFRLEVADSTGRVSAESFRFANPKPVVVEAKPAPRETAALRAIHKVAPQVPAGIRPRIQGTVGVDVRVRVDERGRVTSAVAVKKRRNGLETYLASRAVAAARQWRFEPARANGVTVSSEQTIHFNFER